MSMSDPISNLLTIIRNGTQARKETVDIPASRMAEKILEIFKKQDYIEDYRIMKTDVQGSYKVYLKYENRKSTITGLTRISRPGLRVYKSKSELPRVLNGMGTAVISTSKGVVDDREARQMNVGGEILCYIW